MALVRRFWGAGVPWAGILWPGWGRGSRLLGRGGMNFVIFPGAISEENYWKMGNCACCDRVKFLIKHVL